MIVHQLVVDFERLTGREALSARGDDRWEPRMGANPTIVELARQRTTRGLRRLADAIDPSGRSATVASGG